MKFVILDEVDYMTKNAQQALKYLLTSKNKNVRFILICNYISKIESSVQDRLLKLQFNQLPYDHIFAFLKNVCKKESLRITDNAIKNIIDTFKSDVRSMINYLQCNKFLLTKKYKYLDNKTLESIIEIIKDETVTKFEDKLYHVSQTFNIERIEVIRRIIHTCFSKDSIDSMRLAKKMSYITHNNIYDIDILIKYVFYNVRGSFNNAFST
jgi:DNA polymerase III delta prime subunit